MAISKVSQANKNAIQNSSVLTMPDRPTEAGYTAARVKSALTNPIFGDHSVLTELDRVVEEANTELNKKTEKVSNANGKIPKFDSNGDLVSSGIDASSVATEGYVDTAAAAKANKASTPTEGHVATLDASGNVTDSGIAKTAVVTSSDLSSALVDYLQRFDSPGDDGKIIVLAENGKDLAIGAKDFDDLAANLTLAIDSDYKLTAVLKDGNGNTIATSNTIDLPLESMVIGASYANGTVTLQLKSDDDGNIGNTVSFSISDLVSGLMSTVPNATEGHLASFDSSGDVKDSGLDKDAVATKTYVDGADAGKANKASNPTAGHVATLDASGNVTDSGLAADDVVRQDGAYEKLSAGQVLSTVRVTDRAPYNFRTSGGSIDIGTREYDTLVGGTLAWNQLHQPTSGTASGITFTAGADGTVSFSSESTPSYSITTYLTVSLIPGHVYLWDKSVSVTAGSDTIAMQGRILSSGSAVSTWWQNKNIYTVSSSVAEPSVRVELINLNAVAGAVSGSFTLQIIDLTQLFGATIANYLQTLETGTTGAGAAWFRNLFPKPYYAYDAGTLMSVNAASHDMTGFNAYDHATGKANLLGGKAYQITGAYTSLAYAGIGGAETITPDSDGKFTPANNGILTVTGGDGTTTCVHLVWDGERDGEYEAYKKRAYPLDSALTLRGIPKLDANNKRCYDGDTYAPDGTVTRKYGVVDLGTLTWTAHTNDGLDNVFETAFSPGSNAAVCSKYVSIPGISAFNETDKAIRVNKTNQTILIHDSAFSNASSAGIAAFQSAMNGVYLVYELATSTTESATPFTTPQFVDDWGTEAYVDYAESQGTRDVAVPVGHVTEYTANLRAKLEMAPESPSGDGDYLVRQTNGVNAYVALVKELPAYPTTDGTYHLQVVVASGTPTLSWVADT